MKNLKFYTPPLEGTVGQRNDWRMSILSGSKYAIKYPLF